MIGPAHRGRGLGQKMVAEMVARSEKTGAKRLTLKAKEDRAATFYCRNGFRVVGHDGDFALFEREIGRASRCREVAIHQPNYLPWLGYFYKIARADTFVFLENAQFSKGSYTNRVRILLDGEPRWLTQPIQHKFGQKIAEIKFSTSDWTHRNISTLKSAYKDTDAFGAVFPVLSGLLEASRDQCLAAVNRRLIEALCDRLSIDTKFVCDTDLGVDNETSDDRLIQLVQACAPNTGRYLSGAGGQKYQDEEKFRAAGIDVEYSDYEHPTYDQGTSSFIPGLSIVDALFRLGWEKTAQVIDSDREVVG